VLVILGYQIKLALTKYAAIRLDGMYSLNKNEFKIKNHIRYSLRGKELSLSRQCYRLEVILTPKLQWEIQTALVKLSYYDEHLLLKIVIATLR